MKLVLVTDAAEPQINGVVNSLANTTRCLESFGHEVIRISPLSFKTFPCPTYPEIRLSWNAGKEVARVIDTANADAIHIATEGPLGLAARRHCLRTGRKFTTAYHTRFPEYVKARFHIPLAITYRFLKWFHGPTETVMAPTMVVINDLNAYGIMNTSLWTRGVDTSRFCPGERTHEFKGPVFLYVGRVSVEKGIESFLSLDLPGTKVVVGDGPLRTKLEKAYPDAVFVGAKKGQDLVRYYQLADVFVFPSRSDTFGLVMLEAIACGTPVAAFPVTGPIDVLKDSPAASLQEDLRAACLAALDIPREVARAEALKNSWEAASRQFESHLRQQYS
jgi:glycosyltransferase involved in cell wall biosynthesis